MCLTSEQILGKRHSQLVNIANYLQLMYPDDSDMKLQDHRILWEVLVINGQLHSLHTQQVPSCLQSKACSAQGSQCPCLCLVPAVGKELLASETALQEAQTPE